MTATLLFLLKATLLLAVAFAAVATLRTAPALRRHVMWSLTFVALLVLPLLVLVIPDLNVPLPSWSTRVAPITPPAPPSSPSLTVGISSTPASINVPSSTLPAEIRDVPDRFTFTRMQLLLALWLTGAVVGVAVLVISVARVRRLVALGTQVTDPGWLGATQRIAATLGLARAPRLVSSHAIVVPMAGTFGAPTIFLPADAAQWDAERRDVVLTHEMTHLLRNDQLRILTARVARAIYWFHPLMWLAERRSAADCEQACDENVLAFGVRPSTYAKVLLDFAAVPAAPALTAAVPIVNRHRLETRLMSILSNADRRPISTARAVATTLAAVGTIVAVAAAQPTAAVAATQATAASVVAQGAPAAVAVASSGAMAAVSGPVTKTSIATATAPAPTAKQPEVTLGAQGGRCWDAYSVNRDFSGTFTRNGARTINRIGISEGERIAQMSFGDLRVCMVTYGYQGSETMSRPSDWMGRAGRVVLETESDNDVRRLEINDGRTTWTINGRSASLDNEARDWRNAALDLLDASWQISTLRGEESSLRGEISSIQGERSSLLGEISSLRGEDSSMQGEISSIRGHESSLRGEISSERGAISSLEATRWDRTGGRDIAALIRDHEKRIREIEAEIERYDAAGRVRAVEREIAAYDADRRVAEVERRLREFDVERKVRAVEREIDNLSVERKVQGIENEIRDLIADTRVRRLETERDVALDRLRSILGIR